MVDDPIDDSSDIRHCSFRLVTIIHRFRGTFHLLMDSGRDSSSFSRFFTHFDQFVCRNPHEMTRCPIRIMVYTFSQIIRNV